jgi:hypothetical protein
MPQWLERINPQRMVVFCAVSLGIALGLCGLNMAGFAALQGGMGGRTLVMTGLIELAAILLAVLGLALSLLLVVIKWLAGLGGPRDHTGGEIQRLLEPRDSSREPEEDDER